MEINDLFTCASGPLQFCGEMSTAFQDELLRRKVIPACTVDCNLTMDGAYGMDLLWPDSVEMNTLKGVLMAADTVQEDMEYRKYIPSILHVAVFSYREARRKQTVFRFHWK